MRKNKGELLNEIPSIGTTAEKNRKDFLAKNPGIAREARTAQEAEELEWRVRTDAARAEIERHGTTAQTDNKPKTPRDTTKKGFFERWFGSRESGKSDTL